MATSLPSVSVRVVGCALVLLSVVRCDSTATGKGGPPGSATGPTAAAPIGASGGVVASTDGSLRLTIPAGALSKNVTITVTPVTPPGPGTLGVAYDLEPSGTTFATPITLTFSYAGLNLGGRSASDLRVATYMSGVWQTLAGFAEDATAQTVSGTTTHFTYYAPIFPPAAAGSPLCAQAIGAGPCPDAASTTVCSELAGSTFQNCAPTASGYAGECCLPPNAPVCIPVGQNFGIAQSAASSVTCATACDNLPTSSAQSCSGTGTTLAATCCFPPNAPTCFLTSQITGETACPAGQSCPPSPPPPTCATVDPCAQYAGSTQQANSCTDGTYGPTATCCFPAGVLPGIGESNSGGSAPDGGISVPPGNPPDASAPPAGDGGNACGGPCTSDSDCSCPLMSGFVNCCDTVNHFCFEAMTSCPVRSDGGGVPPPPPPPPPPPFDGGSGPPGQDAGGGGGPPDASHSPADAGGPPGFYAISVTVFGLSTGNTVVLQDNGADNLSVTGNGSASIMATFVTPLATGQAYDVTVLSQPGGQVGCTVSMGSGVVNLGGPSVTVTCH